MKTDNSQVNGSAAEDQFEDLLGGLELEGEVPVSDSDTLDLTAMDETGETSSLVETEDLLSMENSLEMEDALELDDKPELKDSDSEAEERPADIDSRDSHAETVDDLVSEPVKDDIEAIKDFKAAVLAFEWEINDENMDNFNQQVSRFKERWQDNKILLIFMQILEALGKYISVARAKANPDSIKLLLSVYAGLEKIVTSPRLTPRGQKKILMAEVEKYNDLKLQLKNNKDRQGKVTEKNMPKAGGAAVMMAGHGQVGGDEILVQRAEEEDFPELDARLDSFFDDETLPPVEDKQAMTPPVVPPHPEDDSCPAVDSLLDDMFSDVISKGQDKDLNAEEDVVNLDLGNEEGRVVEEGLVVGADHGEYKGSSPVVGETESLELELSGEDGEPQVKEVSEISTVAPGPEKEEERIVLPESFQAAFSELTDTDEISDEMAAHLRAEILNLRQEWQDQPLLLIINAFLVSLSREIEAGNVEFRRKAREIMLIIYKNLQHVVTLKKSERPLEVAATAEKYLLWKEKVFSVAEFSGKTEKEAVIETGGPDQEISEDDEAILLSESDQEISEEKNGAGVAASQEKISTAEEKLEEQEGELQAEEEGESVGLSEEVTGEEQLFDSPDEENIHEESSNKLGIIDKLKALFRRK